MKKLICFALALVLCLSLVACGGEPDVAGQVAPQQGSVETVPTEPELPENELSLGRMEGGVYTNEYVGYACKLDSNWTFLSAAELEQIPATVSDQLKGSELGDALADTPQFIDMMAENVNDLTTMNVLYQKMSMTERLAYLTLSEEEIINISIEQMDTLIAAYEQTGFAVDSIEKVTVTFMGEERTALHSSMSIQDIPYYTLQFFDYHLGEYSVVTTLSSYAEDRTAALTELFYPLEP